MLAVHLPANQDSQDQSGSYDELTEIQFDYPPSNFKYQSFKDTSDLFKKLQYEAYRIGYFQQYMFINYKPKSSIQVKRLVCKYCSARIKCYRGKNRLVIEFIDNHHFHKTKNHSPQFIKIFEVLREKNIDQVINLIDYFYNEDINKAKRIKNNYFRKFQTFDQTVQKIQQKYQSAKICVWNTVKKGNVKPSMFLLITEDMKESYKRYGQSLNFDRLPYLSSIYQSENYDQFWVQFIFSGMDSNNRLIIFGIAGIALNDQKYHLESQIIRNLLCEFFIRMDFKLPSALIIGNNSHIVCAAQRIKSDFQSMGKQIVVFIGHSYKIKSLEIQMTKKGYQKLDLKLLLSYYQKMISTASIKVFQTSLSKAIKICSKYKQYQILYLFLQNWQKYCYLALPSVYTGFNLSLTLTNMYRAMLNVFKQQQNLYKHFQIFILEQQVLLRKSQKINLAQRTIQNSKSIKLLTWNLAKSLILFKNHAFEKNLCIQFSILNKIVNIYSMAQYLKLDLISQSAFRIYDEQTFYIVSLQQNKKWVCSCMNQTRVGLPCCHLMMVLIYEGKNVSQYIKSRWKAILEPSLNIGYNSRTSVIRTNKNRIH